MLSVQLLSLSYNACFIYTCRRRSAQYTDKRVKVMNQVISGIRVIKMYGWEHAFKELVVSIRR